ncbi:hypothetical protein [Ligilactobacillus agilis]|uniref:hypothetical protein n=1 Tax=Ligilactobacillus agilis TaxID=1601 RepID=UPI0018662C46|nr:hypothetical protein [Ligilactobacillus agilis]
MATLGNNACNYLSKVAFKKQVFAFKNLNTFLKSLALLTESKATTKDGTLSKLSKQYFGADITKAPK